MHNKEFVLIFFSRKVIHPLVDQICKAKFCLIYFPNTITVRLEKYCGCLVDSVDLPE